MKENIKAIRSVIPVPMGEAIQLLKKYDNNVEVCIAAYKMESLAKIVTETGCELKLAKEFYEREKYDFNRTISFINDELFDRNYTPIEGLTRNKLQILVNWINIIQSKDFATSLAYTEMKTVVEALAYLPNFGELSQVVGEASLAYNRIFEGYSDDLPIEEFVRRHRKLDDEVDFLEANRIIPLKLTVLKDEILRHARNLK